MCDKRISGLYITLMATLSNLTYFVHNYYIFWVIETFGIFYPQAFLTVIVFSYMIWAKERFYKLDDAPKETWAVSDTALSKIKQA